MLWVSSSVRAAQPGGGERRLGAGMAAADDDDLEALWKQHDLYGTVLADSRRLLAERRSRKACFSDCDSGPARKAAIGSERRIGRPSLDPHMGSPCEA